MSQMLRACVSGHPMFSDTVDTTDIGQDLQHILRRVWLAVVAVPLVMFVGHRS